MSAPNDADASLVRLSAAVVIAYLSHNTAPPGEIADLIRSVHKSLTTLGLDVEAQTANAPKPAVSIGKSVQDDYIVCLEDGKRLKMLKRYLRAQFGMTPEDYRRKWSLPPTYPMVAPAYASRRSEFAKQIGLGLGVRGGRS